ncbi:MAG TPA: phosphate ABC transporter substrate-binding protein PstS [Polyangiales bacterium]|nr:phosphate ABC transporter substrate-binding protein PstS [Polyangiales bacterium]
MFALAAACSAKKTEEPAPSPSAAPAAAPEPEQPQMVKVQGAGASFPAPLYTRWFKTYGQSHPNVQIDYQSVGSGSGVKAVIDKTVDFGASDAAMTAEEIARVPAGVQLLPMTAGEIVLTYNLEGVTDLKLSRKAYIGIFLGTVKKWNDPAIASANPGVKLPNTPINVVVRADSSGTTFVFTKHLSEISPEFAKSPGVNKMPNWPVGTRSKGNEGVTASVKTTPGSIGYIEYGYAASQKLPMATLENKSAAYIKPSSASGQAALAAATMPDDLIVWLPDPAGADAYPIVTFTWLILYKSYPDQKKLDTLRDFVKYAVTEGQAVSDELGYIPLPAPVVEKVKAAVESVKLANAT